MQNSATLNPTTVPTNAIRNRTRNVSIYTGVVALTGMLLSLYALTHLPVDKTGLALFIVLAITAELTSVELFRNSRSYVSMSSIIAIASVVALGPVAGAVTYLASGLATAIKSSLQSNNTYQQRASLLQRTSFNAGMWVIAGFIAGHVFVLTGGTPGALAPLAVIPALFATSTIEWLVNALLLIGVLSLQTGQSAREIWNRDMRWHAPVSIIGGILGGGFLALAYGMFGLFGVLIVLLPILSTSYAFRAYKSNMQVYVEGLETLNQDLKDALTALEKSNVDLTGALSALEQSNQDLTHANESIRRLNAELFQSLAKVFDMRDPYVGGHAAQVAVYAVAIATEMGLPPEQIELIRQAAYLHDIGKLSIPEAILHKPGKLTNIEYDFIKKHTDIGADLLASVEGLRHLAPFVRHHHERWDGRGYPMGLAGEDIPLEARILNICDSVETMASDRPYHRGMSMSAIVEEVRRCAGTQFDPIVAETFVRLVLERTTEHFIVNSARSVTQQYAASMLANESLTHSMFAWVLERAAQK